MVSFSWSLSDSYFFNDATRTGCILNCVNAALTAYSYFFISKRNGIGNDRPRESVIREREEDGVENFSKDRTLYKPECLRLKFGSVGRSESLLS